MSSVLVLDMSNGDRRAVAVPMHNNNMSGRMISLGAIERR